MKKKINMDDGFNPELIGKAFFDGILEIPKIEPIDNLIIPDKMIPINKLSSTDNYSEIIVPYVFDTEFGDAVKNPQNYVELFKKISSFSFVGQFYLSQFPLMRSNR